MPTLHYELDKEDYLAFYLHNASISERIIKKRKSSRIPVTLVYIVLGAVLVWSEVYLGSGIFFSVAVLWYFFYPKYEAKKYIKHFKAAVEESFKPDPEAAGKLVLGEEYLVGSNSAAETKVKTSEIERIDETGKHIILRFSPGMGFIIPKEKVANLEEVYQWLDELEKKLGIKRTVNLGWEWR